MAPQASKNGGLLTINTSPFHWYQFYEDQNHCVALFHAPSKL